MIKCMLINICKDDTGETHSLTEAEVLWNIIINNILQFGIGLANTFLEYNVFQPSCFVASNFPLFSPLSDHEAKDSNS